MQTAVLVERLLFAIGITLLSGSVLQYRAATAGPREAEPFTLPGAPLAQLRPLAHRDKYYPVPKDGEGVELLLGRRCLDANPKWAPHVGVWNCTWSKYQRFNWTGTQIVLTTLGADEPRCAAAAATLGERGGRIVLARCNGTDPMQRWNYTAMSGRHRRFGLLVNNGTGHCLTRVFPPGSSHGDFPVTAPCAVGADAARSTCDQSWYLPRSRQRYFNASLPPAPLPFLPRPLLRSAGRVLCWVLTHPGSHDTKAAAVNRTWGSRCDRLVFITTEEVPGLPARVLDLAGPEGREQLWNKSRSAWMHVHERYLDEFDWFVKADDDTYMSVGNLHEFLSVHDPADKHYFGRVFMLNGRPARTFVSGGSGIVLSRASLAALGAAVNATRGRVWAPATHGPEDLLTADTLKQLGVRPGVSVDRDGRQFFLPLGPHFEYAARARHDDPTNWFYKYSRDAQPGPQCCSRHWVASHYVRADDMYRLDNLETVECPRYAFEWPHWARDEWGEAAAAAAAAASSSV